MVGKQKSLMMAYKEIADMANRMGAEDSLIKKCKELYKKVDDRGALKGTSHSAIATACMYIACRQNKVTRTFKEICAISKEKRKKKIGRCYTKVCEELGIKLDTIDPNQYIPRWVEKLGFDETGEFSFKVRSLDAIASAAFNIDIALGYTRHRCRPLAYFARMRMYDYTSLCVWTTIIGIIFEGFAIALLKCRAP